MAGERAAPSVLRRLLGSVRARVTALAVATVALVLVVGGIVLVATLQRSLTASGDDLAQSRAHDIATLAVDGRLPRHLTNVGDDSMAQVVNGDGQVLAASASLDRAGAVSSFVPDGDDPVVRTMRDVPDDEETEDYRVWVLGQQTSSGPVVVYVGTSLESVQETVGTLRQSLLVGVPLVVLLLGPAMWWLVGRALSPVEGIRSAVEAISPRELDRRVPVPPVDDEIGKLAATMNAMLERLDTASRQQREFVANASHELRSPLAAFRSQLEVSLAQPRTADWPRSARTLLAESAAMERLVHDLLYLARDESALQGVPQTLVDLDDVVLEEVERLRPAARVSLDASRVSAAPVRGSRDDLARLVRNLLDNAGHYARELVTVGVRDDGPWVELVVGDDGPGVSPEHREHVFDRFYRADESRSRGTGGTGLGLAIVRAIAERHGGRVWVADASAGARFVVHLPHPDPATPPSP